MSLIEEEKEKPKNIKYKIWKLTHTFFGMVSKRMEEKEIIKANLADELEVSPAHVTQLLEGEPNITIKKMAKIADAVDLTLKITSEEIDILKDEYWAEFKEEECYECLEEYYEPSYDTRSNTVTHTSTSISERNVETGKEGEKVDGRTVKHKAVLEEDNVNNHPYFMA